MTLIRLFAAVLTAGLATLASAQPTPTAAPAASAPAKDCAKSNRHDHGAEKGVARPKSADCDAAGAPKKKVHDHQQVHK